MQRHQWVSTGVVQPSVLRGGEARAEFRCSSCGAFGWASVLPGDEPERPTSTSPGAGPAPSPFCTGRRQAYLPRVFESGFGARARSTA